MEPKIIMRDKFTVLGLLTRLATEEQNEQVFKSVWSEFEAHLEEIKDHSIDRAYYGISFTGDQSGRVDYCAAMAVSPSIEVPDGMVLREVPGSRYAVFECGLQSIGETYQFIFSKWLPGSSYVLSPAAPVFEQYPPEGQESKPVRIHIPIEE